MDIAGKVFIVTGGASGLGNAVARHIVAAGGRVTLLDVQEGPGMEAAKAIGSQAGVGRLSFGMGWGGMVSGRRGAPSPPSSSRPTTAFS